MELTVTVTVTVTVPTAVGGGGVVCEVVGLAHILVSSHLTSHTVHNSLSPPSQGTAGILQLCNTARHNVVITYVPIYHAFY